MFRNVQRYYPCHPEEECATTKDPGFFAWKIFFKAWILHWNIQNDKRNALNDERGRIVWTLLWLMCIVFFVYNEMIFWCKEFFLFCCDEGYFDFFLLFLLIGICLNCGEVLDHFGCGCMGFLLWCVWYLFFVRFSYVQDLFIVDYLLLLLSYILVWVDIG